MKAAALARFDPDQLAHAEKENYVAYYQKEWLRLLKASVTMVRQAYQLNPLRGLYAAYLVARAEIAFAPFPANDLQGARAYLRRLFAWLKAIHHLDLDVDQAAESELHWWQVHRQLFGREDNALLVEALQQALAAFYCLPPDKFKTAAEHRARGMLLSDWWVNGGRAPGSPFLAQEEAELREGYRALKAALHE